MDPAAHPPPVVGWTHQAVRTARGKLEFPGMSFACAIDLDALNEERERVQRVIAASLKFDVAALEASIRLDHPSKFRASFYGELPRTCAAVVDLELARWWHREDVLQQWENWTGHAHGLTCVLAMMPVRPPLHLSVRADAEDVARARVGLLMQAEERMRWRAEVLAREAGDPNRSWIDEVHRLRAAKGVYTGPLWTP